MRSLFLFALGLALGAVGTVLFFTLDPTFDGGGANNVVGGGNASLTLDEAALSALATRELRSWSEFAADAVVKADIREDGLITFEVVVGALQVGVKSSITVDPEVVDGRLALLVMEASLGRLALPEDVARRLEAPLQERLDSLAGQLNYRLLAIATTADRLTLEIVV